MNLKFQSYPEAVDEVQEVIAGAEDWLTVEEVADWMDIDPEENPEAFQDLSNVLLFAGRNRLMRRLKTLSGLYLYKA